MYRDSQTRERCVEHNLALGPGGECVLCRRGRARPASQRWLGPAVAAAGLGTLLLGGAALARTRAPSSVQATRELAAIEPVPAAMAMEGRPALVAAPRSELRDAPEPSPRTPATPAPPPRNYLDEAYAAMRKAHLYDEARPGTAAPSSTCPCRTHGCQRTFVSGTYVPRHASGPAAPPMLVGMQPPASAPVPMYGRSGGSFSRGGGVRH